MQVMAGAPVGGAEAFFERLVMALDGQSIEQAVVVRHHQERVRRLRDAGIEPETLRFGGFTRLGGYYNLKYYRHCDHLVANTHGIRRYLVDQGWDPERVHYLPNFVEFDDVDRPSAAPSVSPVTRHIFAAGRLHENKGLDVLIRALPMVKHAHLDIAGSGPLARSLQGLASEVGVADRISWLGWVDGLSEHYRASDLFVCPSRHEPLGNVIVEAWAHRCPVVAAAAQGPLELIENGTDGLLVEIDDHVALAGAINKVLDEPALGQSMAAAGYARYVDSFSKDVVVGQYMNFFESIVS